MAPGPGGSGVGHAAAMGLVGMGGCAAAGRTRGRGFGRFREPRPLQGAASSLSEHNSPLFVQHISPGNPGVPFLSKASVAAQGRVEDSCPSAQPFLLSREFINGSDAFCTSVASGMLAAMLEKLRGAAGSDGQQCQILQQISGVEVRRGRERGPSGSCRAGAALAPPLFYTLDSLVQAPLDGADAMSWSPLDTCIKAQGHP